MRIKPYILLIILIGWGAYLLIQNFCLTPDIVKHLLFWAGHIFLLSIILLISMGLGEIILNRFKLTPSPLERKIFGAGLGLSALGFIVFFLGIFKLYYFFTGFILTGVLFIILWPQIKKILIDLLDLARNSAALSFSQPLRRLILIAIIISLLIILMGTLIPPLDYDALEYHLGVPAQYIKAHGIIYMPYNVFSNFPLHMEMLYTLSLLLGSPILAKMLHFLFLILTLFIILLIGNKISAKAGLLPSTRLRQSGLCSALIFVNIPIVAITSAKAYNDLGLTFFGLLTIYCLWIWQEQKDKKLLILAGLFCGSSLAMKYTAIIFFLAPLAVFIFISSLRQKREIAKFPCFQVMLRPLLFVVISLLVVSPWFIKNLVYKGNPVFPLAYKQFGGHNWGDFEADRFKKHHQADLTDFKKVLDAPKKIVSGQEGNIGFTILLFIPFLFFIKRPMSPIKCFGLYSIFYFLFWIFFTHHMPRFLMPALAILSILAAYSISYFLNTRKYISYSMITLLTIGLVFNSARLFYQFSVMHPLQFISGKDSKTEYLSKVFYLHPAIDFMNINLPESSKTLFVAEARTFYCEKDIVSNTPLDKNIIVEIANKSTGAKDILNALQDMGITHVLYNFTEAKRISFSYDSFNWIDPKAQNNYMDFMEKYLKILFSQEGVIVAEIKDKPKL